MSSKPHPRWSLVAALAFVLLGSVFPRGYMPLHNGNRIIIALCSGGEAKSVSLDLGKKDDLSRHAGSAYCQGLLPAATVLPGFPPIAHVTFDPAPRIFLPRARSAVSTITVFDPNAPPQAPPFA
jgi:hypothetical protein